MNFRYKEIVKRIPFSQRFAVIWSTEMNFTVTTEIDL